MSFLVGSLAWKKPPEPFINDFLSQWVGTSLYLLTLSSALRSRTSAQKDTPTSSQNQPWESKTPLSLLTEKMAGPELASDWAAASKEKREGPSAAKEGPSANYFLPPVQHGQLSLPA